jgi:hypothetical protein
VLPENKVFALLTSSENVDYVFHEIQFERLRDFYAGFVIKEFLLFIHWLAEPQTSRARATAPNDVLPIIALKGGT